MHPSRDPAEFAARRRARLAYADLYEATTRLLLRHDFAQLASSGADDEYALEARSILPRLRECSDEADVARALQAEFARWFSPVDAGPLERFRPAASELWILWRRHLPAVTP